MECAYIKTWQGEVLNSTSNRNAGGGGSGIVKNITFRDFQLENVALPIQIRQCIYAQGNVGCNNSKIAISDVHWVNFNGTSRYNIAASLYCAASHPCPGVTFDRVNITGINQTEGYHFVIQPYSSKSFSAPTLLVKTAPAFPATMLRQTFIVRRFDPMTNEEV